MWLQLEVDVNICFWGLLVIEEELVWRGRNVENADALWTRKNICMYLPFCVPLTASYRRYFHLCASLNSTFFVLMSYIKCRWRWHIHVSFLLWFWACCMSSTCANHLVLTSNSYTKYHNCILFIESAFACNNRPLKLSFFLLRSARVRPLFSLLRMCAGLVTILTLLGRERIASKWI